MIPVTLKPEPENFDTDVRQRGHAWLGEKGIALTKAPPKASILPTYWRCSNKQLWEAYFGVCAYLAIYFEWVTGASSTDHFIAKSRHAGDAYEWNNYRLCCMGANRNKTKFDDVLDPFSLAPDTFILNLVTGCIKANPAHGPAVGAAVKKTIRRLTLNSPEHKAMRAKHFSWYVRNKDACLLKELSPFVWNEAKRQGLL